MSDRKAKKRTSTGRKSDAADSKDEKRTTLGAGAQALPTGGGIFKSAAVAVLRQERKLMTTGEITKCAIATGLLKCQGKTPKSTMDSALYTDVKRKMQASVFTRPQEGLFGLREWISEGFFPEGWAEGAAERATPFKQRRTSNTGAAPKSRGVPRAPKPRAKSSWMDGSSDFDDDEDDDSATATASEEVDEELEAEMADDDGRDEALEDDGETETDDDGGGDGGGPGLGKGLAGGRRDLGPQDLMGGGLDGVKPSPRLSNGGKRPHLLTDRSRDFDRHSPLHLLAAASKSAQQAESGGVLGAGGGRKRRLTTGASDPRGDEVAPSPKSIYEDSLAALHEIATSPISYAPHGIIDLTSRGDQKQRRPRHLIVDMPHDVDGALIGGLGQLPGSLTTPSSLFRGLDSSLPNLPDSYLSNPGFIRAPLMLNIPNLVSPSTSYQLDPGSLMSLQLPDMLQGTPHQHDLLSASLMHGGSLANALLTPMGLAGLRGFTPRGVAPNGNRGSNGGFGGGTALLDGLAAAAQLAPMRPLQVNGTGLPPKNGQHNNLNGGGGGGGGGAMNLQQVLGGGGLNIQQLRVLGGNCGAAVDLGRLTPASNAPSGSRGTTLLGRPDVKKLTPAQVDAELLEIGRVQGVVERLEAKLGRAHPQVGKAWLALARMYQHVGAAGSVGMDRASKALERAWTVCRNCAQGYGLALHCDDAFTYLQARVIFSGSDDAPIGGGGGGSNGGMGNNPPLVASK